MSDKTLARVVTISLVGTASCFVLGFILVSFVGLIWGFPFLGAVAPFLLVYLFSSEEERTRKREKRAVEKALKERGIK